MSKWIQIWYSWGDQESPVEISENTDAWEHMKKLAFKEIEVSQEEYPYGCGIWLYPDEDKIVIKYYEDDEYCYYLITDTEDFIPDDTFENDNYEGD